MRVIITLCLYFVSNSPLRVLALFAFIFSLCCSKIFTKVSICLSTSPRVLPTINYRSHCFTNEAKPRPRHGKALVLGTGHRATLGDKQGRNNECCFGNPRAFCTRVYLFTEHKKPGFAPVVGGVIKVCLVPNALNRKMFKIHFSPSILYTSYGSFYS